jgi:hypothetical protein
MVPHKLVQRQENKKYSKNTFKESAAKDKKTNNGKKPTQEFIPP